MKNRNEICIKQEVCTVCPARKGCVLRKSFYNHDLYVYAHMVAMKEFMTIEGEEESTFLLMEECIKKHDKKRNEEIRIHPVFQEE